MFCSNCGKKIEESRQFCPSCGQKLPIDSGKEADIKRKVEEGIVNILQTENTESGTERNTKNVIISFMTESMYKLFFYGSIVAGILTALQGIGIIWLIITFLIMKQKWAAKVKGFIVDYDKRTIYFPECNAVNYNTGFPGFKNWLNDFRSGKEISFRELKSISGSGERDIKQDDSGNYHVNDYNILNVITTFGSIRIK